MYQGVLRLRESVNDIIPLCVFRTCDIFFLRHGQVYYNERLSTMLCWARSFLHTAPNTQIIKPHSE